MSPNWDSRIFKVVYQKGAALKLRSDSGVLIFRNVTHVRPYLKEITVRNQEFLGKLLIRVYTLKDKSGRLNFLRDSRTNTCDWNVYSMVCRTTLMM